MSIVMPLNQSLALISTINATINEKVIPLFTVPRSFDPTCRSHRDPTRSDVGLSRNPMVSGESWSDPTTVLSDSFQSDSESDTVGKGTDRFRSNPPIGLSRIPSAPLFGIHR